MGDLADRAYIYVQNSIPCPACGGELVITLPVWLTAVLDQGGVSDDEFRERLEAHLMQRKIVCSDCRDKPQG